jgi:hypothetical protein
MAQLTHSLLMSMLLLWALWGCTTAHREPTSPQLPQKTDDQIRQEWETYERELRAWCAENFPDVIEQCIRDELVRYYVKNEPLVIRSVEWQRTISLAL